MKTRFFLIVASIIALLTLASARAEDGAVSPQEKTLRDTLITIDTVSGRADTVLANWWSEGEHWRIEDDLFESNPDWEFDLSGYTSKIVFVPKQGGNQQTTTVYRKNKRVRSWESNVSSDSIERQTILGSNYFINEIMPDKKRLLGEYRLQNENAKWQRSKNCTMKEDDGKNGKCVEKKGDCITKRH